MELEADSLRRQLQQIAHSQRARANELLLQKELNLRKAEWTSCVAKYMATVDTLDRLQGLAVQAVRNDNLIACLEAAQIEIDRVRLRFGGLLKTLDSLNGININNESIDVVRKNTDRLVQLTATMEQIVSQTGHINQGEKVRQFVQKLSTMAQNLSTAESNAKYKSMKTINISSDVLLAKHLKDIPVEEDHDDD